MLRGQGVAVVQLRTMPPQVEPPLYSLFGDDVTQFDLLSRALVVTLSDVTCQQGRTKRALADLYVLQLRLGLFPWWPGPRPQPRYHAYTGPEDRWMLQHDEAKAGDADDKANLFIGAPSGGVWMVLPTTVGPVLDAVVPEADIAVDEDSVAQLAVRYLEGDACAAKKLLASPAVATDTEDAKPLDTKDLEALAANCDEPGDPAATGAK
jgi:hypothetical protein